MTMRRGEALYEDEPVVRKLGTAEFLAMLA